MSESDSGSNNRLELFGQKIPFPNNKWAALSVAIVAISLCVIAYIVIQSPTALETIQVLRTGQLLQGGKVESTGKNQLIQFWTPSAKTKNANVEDIEPWEKLESDDMAIAFGNILRSDQRISGFRRYEVYGTGLRGLKAGFWWVVTAKQDYKLAEFKETYRTFWKNEKSIYIEVIREGGGQQER